MCRHASRSGRGHAPPPGRTANSKQASLHAAAPFPGRLLSSQRLLQAFCCCPPPFTTTYPTAAITATTTPTTLIANCRPAKRQEQEQGGEG